MYANSKSLAKMMKVIKLAWTICFSLIILNLPVLGQNQTKDDLDFILKDDKEKRGFIKSSDMSIRFGMPISLTPLPDSIKFSPFNSLGTGIYFRYKLKLTQNFNLAISPMIWFHKIGYKPSTTRVFPTIDSSNTLEKLRSTSLGLSIEMQITVARDNKGRAGFIIAPGFEVDFPLVQTLKKNYTIKNPNGTSYDAKTKITGLDIFYPYRYSAYLLIGHRTVGVRVAYWFTPWFQIGKYESIKGVPVVSEQGSRTIPPVSQIEVGIYWGLSD